MIALHYYESVPTQLGSAPRLENTIFWRMTLPCLQVMRRSHVQGDVRRRKMDLNERLNSVFVCVRVRLVVCVWWVVCVCVLVCVGVWVCVCVCVVDGLVLLVLFVCGCVGMCHCGCVWVCVCVYVRY